MFEPQFLAPALLEGPGLPPDAAARFIHAAEIVNKISDTPKTKRDAMCTFVRYQNADGSWTIRYVRERDVDLARSNSPSGAISLQFFSAKMWVEDFLTQYGTPQRVIRSYDDRDYGPIFELTPE